MTLAKPVEEEPSAEPNVRAVTLLRAWQVEDAPEDPSELEARRLDWEATKAALNESHGSGRKLFP